MMKTENLPLVRISIRGKSGDISLIEEEPGLSLEEWKHVRDAAFARLRKAVTIIPRQLIDLVEQLNHRTLVQIFFNKTLDGSGLSFGIKPLGKKTKGSVGETENTNSQNLITASEALAFFLRVTLRDLKHAEKQRTAAPVRTSNLVPRSVISEIAMDLLDSCTDAPGPFLNQLFRELLNVGSVKHGAPRELEAQEQAAFAIAQYPTVRTRELARKLKVNASTISRWRRSREFQAKIEQAAETIRRWNEEESREQK